MEVEARFTRPSAMLTELMTQCSKKRSQSSAPRESAALSTARSASWVTPKRSK
jgi:hypothetical protein